MELFNQLHLVHPRIFSSAVQFGMRYCAGKVVRYGPGLSRHDFSGSSNMEELKILLEET